MPDAREPNFRRLADGTLLQRQADGSYRPAQSLTNHARLAALTDDEVDAMDTDDADHPALDDAFWSSVDHETTLKEAVSIELDSDILSYFRQQGRGYQTRINAVLRRYVDSVRKTGSGDRR